MKKFKNSRLSTDFRKLQTLALKSCNHPCFQISSWRFKIRFFLVHKHSNVKKSSTWGTGRLSTHPRDVVLDFSPFPWSIPRILAICEAKKSYVTRHTIKFKTSPKEPCPSRSFTASALQSKRGMLTILFSSDFRFLNSCGSLKRRKTDMIYKDQHASGI